jgi:hypothetical protein
MKQPKDQSNMDNERQIRKDSKKEKETSSFTYSDRNEQERVGKKGKKKSANDRKGD